MKTLNIKDVKHFTFSGGEEFVKLNTTYTKRDKVRIEAFVKNSSDLMKLLLVTDAVRRQGVRTIDLVLPYVPYARQDRVMTDGESLSIKVLADLINLQNYRHVYTLDNHSPVSTALINNCIEIPIMNLIKQIPMDDNTILICPDAGAKKKLNYIARELGKTLIYCDKVRNVQTGEILHTEIKCDKFHKKHNYLIIDDICDGGRTFIEIAKILKERGAGEVNLYVTHGIFSKGFAVFNQLIDRIFCTTLFNTGWNKFDNGYQFKQIKLNEENYL